MRHACSVTVPTVLLPQTNLITNRVFAHHLIQSDPIGLGLDFWPTQLSLISSKLGSKRTQSGQDSKPLGPKLYEPWNVLYSAEYTPQRRSTLDS